MTISAFLLDLAFLCQIKEFQKESLKLGRSEGRSKTRSEDLDAEQLLRPLSMSKLLGVTAFFKP
jgi:hypothetical protein